jgi:hypothetical protein
MDKVKYTLSSFLAQLTTGALHDAEIVAATAFAFCLSLKSRRDRFYPYFSRPARRDVYLKLIVVTAEKSVISS